MIIGTTPDVVNSKLKAAGGFDGALVIWSKVEVAFPGIKVNRVRGYNNSAVLANIPNVMVEVPAWPIGGTGSHWVVFIGNHRLYDPWTGLNRSTADFPNPTGYTTITGKWKGDNQTGDCQQYKDRIQQIDQERQDIKNTLASNDFWWTKLDKIQKIVNSNG